MPDVLHPFHMDNKIQVNALLHLELSSPITNLHVYTPNIQFFQHLEHHE